MAISKRSVVENMPDLTRGLKHFFTFEQNKSTGFTRSSELVKRIFKNGRSRVSSSYTIKDGLENAHASNIWLEKPGAI